MNKDLQEMHLKQLVNDKECYEQFQQHIDDLIFLRQRVGNSQRTTCYTQTTRCDRRTKKAKVTEGNGRNGGKTN